MPSTSNKQRRFFGALLAYKRGDLKGASPEIKKASSSISESDAADFAGSVVKKRKNLAENMTKKRSRYA